MTKKIKDDVIGTCSMHRLRKEWSEYARIKCWRHETSAEAQQYYIKHYRSSLQKVVLIQLANRRINLKVFGRELMKFRMPKAAEYLLLGERYLCCNKCFYN